MWQLCDHEADVRMFGCSTNMATAVAQSRIELANARIQASSGWASQEYPKLE
jgi:hypothetical protein